MKCTFPTTRRDRIEIAVEENEKEKRAERSARENRFHMTNRDITAREMSSPLRTKGSIFSSLSRNDPIREHLISL